jgi:ferredoxin-NADP reductase
MKVTFDHKQPLTEHINTFWFKPEKPLRYTAGQYTEFVLAHEHADNRGQKRWFTLSSSPTEAMVSITTKISDPSSTFKRTLLTLSPGDELNFHEPMGDFVLPKDPGLPLLFVGGGIGVTPMRSMAKWLTDVGQKRQIKLLYAVNYQDDLIFVPTFKKAGYEVIPFVKEPPEGYTGQTGMLDAQRIISYAQSKETIVYLSGPEPMIEALNDQLEKVWPKRQIRTDFFPGYSSF